MALRSACQPAIYDFLQSQNFQSSFRPMCPQLLSLRHLRSAPSGTSDASLERLEQAFTSGVAQQLATRGFAIVDGVFGGKHAMSLRQEIISLYQAGRMHLNNTHLVRGQTTELLQKRGIYEAELRDPDIQAAAPLLGHLQNDSTLRTLLSVYLPHLTLTSQALKAQLNVGSGACFPMHFDSDEAVDSRCLSALFYLNQASANEGCHVGLPRTGAQPVDIAPRHDRLVLFASTRMLHRVLPAHAQRVCFTLWMSQARPMGHTPRRPSTILLREMLGQASASGKIDDVAAHKLLQTADIQKLAAKLHYADEWAESIQESHDDSPGRNAHLERYLADLEVTRRILRPLEPLLRRSFPSSTAPVLL